MDGARLVPWEKALQFDVTGCNTRPILRSSSDERHRAGRERREVRRTALYYGLKFRSIPCTDFEPAREELKKESRSGQPKASSFYQSRKMGEKLSITRAFLSLTFPVPFGRSAGPTFGEKETVAGPRTRPPREESF